MPRGDRGRAPYTNTAADLIPNRRLDEVLRSVRKLAFVLLPAVLIGACGSAPRAADRTVSTAPAASVRPVDDVQLMRRSVAVRRATFVKAVAYAAAVGHNLDLARWQHDVVEPQQRAARLAAQQRQQAAAPAPVSSRGRGPHTEAWWHGVAICEQGGRNDSYFGYFSYMDGSAGGGQSWEAQVARGNRTIAQYGDHAWAQQCVTAGYSASPNG